MSNPKKELTQEELEKIAGPSADGKPHIAVTAVPDEKKGERLVVLHTMPDPKPVIEKLAACDLPNLWKPRADQFFRLDALPYLGTGKLDLRKVRELAQKFALTTDEHR